MNPNRIKTCLAICAIATGLAVTAPAAEVVADFNDMNLGEMRQVNQPPGTGVGFVSDYWTAGTGTQRITDGDLVPSATGYNVTQEGNARKMHTNNAVGRQQARECEPLDGSEIWMSVMLVKPTAAGRAGVGFNQSLTGYTAGDPRIVWLDNEVQFRLANVAAGSAPLTSTTDTVLVIARIQPDAGAGGEDLVEIWLDPADVTSVGAMGAAQISVTNQNWLAAPGTISSVHPSVYGATGADSPELDALLLSDGSTGFEFVTGNQMPADPDLVENGSIDPDYDFGLVDDGSGGGLLPVTRSRTFENFGATQPITITAVTLTGDDDGVFSVTTNPDIGGGLVLNPGDFVDVDVEFDNPPGQGAFSGTVGITTSVPDEDMSFPVSATYIMTGDKVISNGTFESANYLAYWGADAATPFGGLAPGSVTAVRTTGNYLQQDFAPAVGDDFEISLYFAVDEVAAAPGNRNFSLFLREGTSGVNHINLGYFPAGGSVTQTTPGFYVFDNVSAGWVPVVFDNGDPDTGNQVTISNSLDALADGDYDDPGDGDVKNVYQMRIAGAEYGDIFYNYRINVYDAAGNLLGWSQDLTEYQGGDPATGQPGRLVFSAQYGNNPGFVVDDVSVVVSEDDGSGLPVVTNPDLQVLGEPTYATMLNPTGTSSSNLVIRNSGSAGTNLNVSAVNFSDPHFSLNGALPGPIAAGGTVTLPIDFTPGVDRGVFPCTISIDSDDSLIATETVATVAAAWDAGDVVNANCDFEATPFDAGWLGNGATLAGGLGGAQAAYIPAGGSGIAQDVMAGGDWEFECSLAVRDSGDRQFTLGIVTDAGGGTSGNIALNLKYGENNLDAWRIFNGAAWVEIPQVNGNLGTILASVDGDGDDSLDNPGGGDVANVYKLKVVGHNWGAGAGLASYDLFLSEANGATYTRAATDLQLFQAAGGAHPDNLVPTGFRLDTQYGNNPGYWVDDACFKATLPVLDDPNLVVEAVPTWGNLVGVTTQAADLVVSNNGAASVLNVTGITFSGAAAANFSVDPSVTFPLVIGAGAPAETIPIVFDLMGASGGLFAATLEIASDDVTDTALGLTRDLDLVVTAFDYGDKVLVNWDFEATPFSTGWTVVEPVAGDLKVNGGLNTGGGSTQCAFLSTANNRLFQAPPIGLENCDLEFYFALSSISGRALNFRVFPNATATGTEIVTFKIEGGTLWTYSGAWQPLVSGLTLSPSLDFNGDGVLDPVGSDPNDIRNVYRIKFSGHKFGTVDANYDVAVLQEDGTPLGSAFNQTIWQGANPATTNQARAVEFNTQNGATPFWVDDVGYTLEEEVAGTDYDTWAGGYGLGGGDAAPGADPDGDGLSNDKEYAFGLDPTDGSSVSPVGVPLDKASGIFTYTRRNTALTGLAYSYQWSTTLDGVWTPFTPELEDGDGGNPVETVNVTVEAALLSNPSLFVRVVAN